MIGAGPDLLRAEIRSVMAKHKPSLGLTDEDYRALAAIRYALKRFIHFSEDAARSVGLTPQQHQALLAIRAGKEQVISIGELSELLLVQPHSASELADRLSALGLVDRRTDERDRRVIKLRLTGEADRALLSLSVAHRDELRRLRPLLSELLAKLD